MQKIYRFLYQKTFSDIASFSEFRMRPGYLNKQRCGTVTFLRFRFLLLKSYDSGSIPVPTFEKVMVPVPTFEKFRFRFQLHI